MRNAEHIKAEHERARILDFLSGRKLSNKQLRTGLNITKGKLSHHLKVLEETKYIIKEHFGGNNYLYKRTRQTFTPTPMPVEVVKPKKETLKKESHKKEIPEDDEETIDDVPTLPHARVIRLLKNPLPKAPKRNRSGQHMYSGIQSTIGMFDGY
jgi:DNA-binding transcriptional ArsR family regulator